MREWRQVTSFIGGPETEIKNVPENQNCPQDLAPPPSSSNCVKRLECVKPEGALSV